MVRYTPTLNAQYLPDKVDKCDVEPQRGYNPHIHRISTNAYRVIEVHIWDGHDTQHSVDDYLEIYPLIRLVVKHFDVVNEIGWV